MSHLTFSVGWLGAVAAYLALAVVGMTSPDAGMARASYRAMKVIGWAVIVPSSVASLLSGILQSVGTEWGLFRYYWIVVKLVLTVVATAVLLMHIPTVTRMARIAAVSALASGDYSTLRLQLLVHAAGGLVVLLATTAVSVYKPWGRIGTSKVRARGTA